MTDMQSIDRDERPGPPGKIRTWWHPLLAWLLEHRLAGGYRVLEEVLGSKLPLWLDILLRAIDAYGARGFAVLHAAACSAIPQIWRGLCDATRRDWEYWATVEASLRIAILKAIPPEERLRGLSPEEMFRGLSEDQAARVYELLERRRGS